MSLVELAGGMCSPGACCPTIFRIAFQSAWEGGVLRSPACGRPTSDVCPARPRTACPLPATKYCDIWVIFGCTLSCTKE